MLHLPTLETLHAQLEETRSGRADALEFVRTLRAQTGLLHALTPGHAVVLDNLLMRLESGNLFSEEGCSFSRRELLDALALWFTHARDHLEQASSA